MPSIRRRYGTTKLLGLGNGVNSRSSELFDSFSSECCPEVLVAYGDSHCDAVEYGEDVFDKSDAEAMIWALVWQIGHKEWIW
jgi:hypothetical protein